MTGGNRRPPVFAALGAPTDSEVVEAAYRAVGRTPGEAVAAATAEFGDPRQVAAAFRPEPAARQARRLARTLIATGP